MSKTRSEKEQAVDQLAEQIGKNKAMVFANFAGLTVPESEELRQKCFDQSIDVKVTKKTLLNLASAKAGVDGFDVNKLEGSVLTFIGYDDEVAPAQLVANFAKDHEEQMNILGGVFEGAFVERDQVIALSKLPSKLELYAKLVGSINAPVSGFVNVLAGNLRGMVNVLNAIKEAKA